MQKILILAALLICCSCTNGIPFKLNYVPKNRTEMTEPAPVFEEMDTSAITEKYAALLSGTGTDGLGYERQLGGLDEGIELKVVGKIGDKYEVRLSDAFHSFVRKDKVNLCPGKLTGPVYAGDITLMNDGHSDILKIMLPQKVPYCSFVELKPTKIYIDLFGVVNGEGWLERRQEAGIIDNIAFVQIGSDILRIELGLKYEHLWGYSVGYEGSVLEIEVKHTPRQYSLKGMVIGIDPGHGGSANGAISVTGVPEKAINLSISRKVRKLLEARGAKVVMTRNEDKDISLNDRVEMFKAEDVDMSVSIHNNACCITEKPRGTGVLYKHVQNRELAACILGRLAQMQNLSLTDLVNTNVTLCMPTEFPAVLVECLFVDSIVDEAKLLSDDGQQEIAERIVAGIEDYIQAVRLDP